MRNPKEGPTGIKEGWREVTRMYVYRIIADMYVVGFYRPDGVWIIDTRWPSREEASKRIHWLNGGD